MSPPSKIFTVIAPPSGRRFTARPRAKHADERVVLRRIPR
jgi:hypothetical protein